MSFDSGLVGFLNSQVPKGEGPDPRQSKFLRAHPSLEESEGWGTHCCGRVQISKNLGCATRRRVRHPPLVLGGISDHKLRQEH